MKNSKIEIEELIKSLLQNDLKNAAIKKIIRMTKLAFPALILTDIDKKIADLSKEFKKLKKEAKEKIEESAKLTKEFEKVKPITHKQIIETMSKSFESEYDSIFKHGGMVGDNREKSLVNFLEKIMPQKYGFDSGEVFDKDGGRSGQIDIIIWDKLYSMVFHEKDKILAPMDSTFGIISAKSKMGNKELSDAIGGIKQYEDLKRSQTLEDEIYINPDHKIEALNIPDAFGVPIISTNKSYNQTINCIFAISTNVADSTILSKIKEAGCVDFVVIGNKKLFIGRKKLDESLGLIKNYSVYEKDSLARFILTLQFYLSKSRLIQSVDSNMVLSILDS